MCGECRENRRRNRAKLRPPARKATAAIGPRPTAAGLERHAGRFGPEQVGETAAQFGLSVAISRATRKSKARGPGLKQRVKALLGRGASTDDIAEVENLSPAKARALVEELS